jgi:NADH-quinone oxidoreductase subunit H
VSVLSAALAALLVFVGVMAVAGGLTLAERKVSAWMQYRVGPNRVGPWGLLQPLADVLKFFFKESTVPEGAHPAFFRLAPALAALPALLAFAAVPVSTPLAPGGRPLGAADLDIGALYVLAVGSLGVYGILIGGWASNNKYSILGGLRAAAQLVSYELALVLTLIAVLASAGTLRLYGVVLAQDAVWNVFTQPVAFALFLVCAFAETNRHPFDFAECEPELVAGYHAEYGATRFMLFYVGEYAAMVTMAGLGTTLFLGGPDVPFVRLADLPWWAGLLSFSAKTGAFLFFYLWVRWTLPRLTYDRLMAFGWKRMLPVSLLNLVATGAVVALS